MTLLYDEANLTSMRARIALTALNADRVLTLAIIWTFSAGMTTVHSSRSH